MSLTPGTRFSHYDITGTLGAGGMGEVFKARDTRLDRAVAIKILPDVFASDPDRLARFEREAKTLASLNHPHVAQIYGVEDTAGVRALVMELVEGEDLSARLKRGAIPLPEGLAIARQIALALEAAHERGVIHRDLKPGNIKVGPDGTVKVLDFGLAKALDPGASSNVMPTNLPTITSPAHMTHAGVILGTAAYMAPEQARGQTVDRRADMWALGIVLYEMLTGRAAFGGETVTDVLAAIVTRDPDWSTLPADTPSSTVRLLKRCLERNPRRRLADAGEAAMQIEESMAAPAAAPPSVTIGPVGRRRGPMVGWLVAGIMTIVAATAVWRAQMVSAPAIHRYAVEVPARTTINTILRPAVTASPDGAAIVFVVNSGGTTRLMVRHNHEFDAVPLVGTEGASNPVFSPDGRWIAFFADNRLNKLPSGGGPVVPLAPVNDPRGLAWDSDDSITLAPESVGGIFQISPDGGGLREITKLAGKSERTHRWPQMLPGGKAVIFVVGTIDSPDNYDSATLEAHIVATGERRVILSGVAMARYVATGHLVFARGATLYAVRFDPDRLAISGTPEPIQQGVAGDPTTGATHYAISRTGALVYVPGSPDGATNRLVWANRKGETQAVGIPVGTYLDPMLSPDGGQIAVSALAGGSTDVWVYDLARKTLVRLTFGGSNTTPIWSADGIYVYYVKLRSGQDFPNTITRRRADGSRDAEELVTIPQRVYLKSISADGKSALIDHQTSSSKTNVERVALEQGAVPAPLVSTPFDEYSSSLSPDRRWLAYQSDETSRFEIYVRSLTDTGGRWQVSTGGGEEPRWSPDGKEIFYRNNTSLMVVNVALRPTFQLSPASLLFDGVYNFRTDSGNTFDVHAKGDRFLMVRPTADMVSFTNVRVVLNWFKELQRR